MKTPVEWEKQEIPLVDLHFNSAMAGGSLARLRILRFMIIMHRGRMAVISPTLLKVQII